MLFWLLLDVTFKWNGNWHVDKESSFTSADYMCIMKSIFLCYLKFLEKKTKQKKTVDIQEVWYREEERINRNTHYQNIYSRFP